jgi:hypothetical protein
MPLIVCCKLGPLLYDCFPIGLFGLHALGKARLKQPCFQIGLFRNLATNQRRVEGRILVEPPKLKQLVNLGNSHRERVRMSHFRPPSRTRYPVPLIAKLTVHLSRAVS